MDSEPRWQPIRLRCLDPKCCHSWSDWTTTNVRVDVWVAVVQTWHCPACGADYEHIAMGGE